MRYLSVGMPIRMLSLVASTAIATFIGFSSDPALAQAAPTCKDGFELRGTILGDAGCVPQARQRLAQADPNPPRDGARPDAGSGAGPGPGPGDRSAPQARLSAITAFKNWATTNSVTNASIWVQTTQDGVYDADAIGSWRIDTIAPIASTSKAITAMCMLTLLDSNRLNLESTVQVLLPTFTSSILEQFRFNAASVRIEHLLRHTSGFALDPTQQNFVTGAADSEPDQWFARQAFNSGLSGIGTTYMYNNVNYAILGMVIKAVTGESYESYCKRTVLTPFGAPNARLATGVRGMEAFGGWEMSVREYANFYTRAFVRSRIDGSNSASRLMNSIPNPGFAIPGCTGCNYGLGVVVVPIGDTPSGPLARHHHYHHGDWNCVAGTSCNGATTPQQFASFAAKWDNIANFSRATEAFVIYDRHVSDAARVALDDNLRNAAFVADPAAPPSPPAAETSEEQMRRLFRN
jgi:CubicO group peptidase (beta-lactamase class C family)